jgi:hypothetical protein
MSNLKAVADAIAAQYVGVTANGESIGIGPTASLPNVIPKGFVALLVYPPSASLEVGVAKQRRDEWDFPVKILRDPIDVPARTDALYAWLDATRDVIYANVDLGLSYVQWAFPQSVRVELDGERYGAAKDVYDVIEYVIRVHIEETVTLAI